MEAQSAPEEKDFYTKLKSLESVRLQELSDVRQQLIKLSQFESEFNQRESDLYNLLWSHSDAMQADYTSAKKRLNALIVKSNSVDIRSRAYSILALIENIQGNDINAFAALDNSLSQISDVEDQIYRLDILQNAVGVYKEAELIEYALEISRRHLTEANRSQLKEPMCHGNYELAAIEIMAQKIKIAEERLKSARNYCQSSNQTLMMYEIALSLSEIAILNENYDKAERILSKVYKEIKQYGWQILTSRSEITYAKIKLGKEEINEAEEFAIKGYKIAKETNDKRRILEASAVLAKIYSKLKDSEKSIEYYKEYMELNNELRMVIRQRKLAFQSTRETQN